MRRSQIDWSHVGVPAGTFYVFLYEGPKRSPSPKSVKEVLEPIRELKFYNFHSNSILLNQSQNIDKNSFKIVYYYLRSTIAVVIVDQKSLNILKCLDHD